MITYLFFGIWVIFAAFGFRKKWAVFTNIGGGFVVAVVGLVAYGIMFGFPKDNVADKRVHSSVAENNNSPVVQKKTSTLIERCAMEAATRGYQTSSCAWPFINVCVTTRSKEEMNKIYNASMVFGGDQIKYKGVCSAYTSNPSLQEYTPAFNKAYAAIKNELEKADRF